MVEYVCIRLKGVGGLRLRSSMWFRGVCDTPWPCCPANS